MGAVLARYYFDVHDGELIRDSVGTICNGYNDIRYQAMHTLPEIAKEQVPKDGDTQSYSIFVRNYNNATVYTATLSFAGRWLGEDIPPIEEPSF
jgi:hypothetical protein